MKKANVLITGWIASFILLFSFANAQTSDSCFAKAPSEVAVGQQFKYTVSANVRGEVVSTDFGKFEFISGPSIGTSTSINMTNGHIDQTTSYTYTYYLSCEKEGNFVIPGITLSVEGRLIKSNYVEVSVVKAPKNIEPDNQQADSWFNFNFPDIQMPSFEDFQFSWPWGNNQPQDNAPQQRKNEKVQIEDKIGKDDIFVKAITTKLEAFQGEGIVVTHKLYVKEGLTQCNIQRAVFAPSQDFWFEGLELKNRDKNTETIGGKTYDVFTIKQTAVYPCSTGKLVIPKLDLTLVMRVPATVKDPFWGTISSYRNKELKLTSNELTVKVKPLPGAHSDNKTEVVGNFQVNSTINKTEAHTNEAIVLTITVSGNGNLHHVNADDLNIDFPTDCDVTYPRVNAHISAKGDIISGSKTFKYTIIPRQEGTYLIPGITYTYYDYDTGRYKTLTTQDYQLEVTPGKAPAAPSNNENEQKKPAVKTYKI